MAKFRKKPVVIDAVQYTGKNVDEILDFARAHAQWQYPHDRMVLSTLENLQGEFFEVSKGDWVIKGVKGEFYPCKPDIFEQTYEPASPVWPEFDDD